MIMETSILIVVIMEKIVSHIVVETIIIMKIGAVMGTIGIEEIGMVMDRMIGAIFVVLRGKITWIIFLVPLLLLPIIAIMTTSFFGKGATK